jgi:hypothetical protein
VCERASESWRGQARPTEREREQSGEQTSRMQMRGKENAMAEARRSPHAVDAKSCFPGLRGRSLAREERVSACQQLGHCACIALIEATVHSLLYSTGSCGCSCTSHRARCRGQICMMTRPFKSAYGTGPYALESLETLALSPRSQAWP